MKNLMIKNNLINKSIVGATALIAMTGGVNAASLTGGNLVLNLDPSIFQSENQQPGPEGATTTAFIERYFDASEANVTRGFELVRNHRDEPDSYFPLSEAQTQGLDFTMNGATVTHPLSPNQNLPARNHHLLQATNFEFDSADIEGSATGQIGFGGLLRVGFGNIDNLPASPEFEPTLGVIGLGDFAMTYDTDDGWVINSTTGFGSGDPGSLDPNTPPTGVRVFSTENVETTMVGDELTISGDLSWTLFVANNGFQFFDTGVVEAGSFSLTATVSADQAAAVVPVPAAVWLFGTGLVGLVGIGRSKAKVV